MRSSTVITNPPAKPLVVFDGDCGFCRRWIEVWRGWTGEAVEYGPSQDPTLRERFPEIPAEHFEASIQLIEPDGSVFSGSEAVFRALAHVPGKRWPLWIYEHVRGADWITEKAYGVVAKHRMPFSALTRWILPPEPLKFALVRSIFLRLLGLTYLFAFLSLWTQVDGLIGSHGLLPINQFIEAIGKTVTGAARWHEIPTLCWLGAGDAGLHFQCGAGVVLSFFLMAGFVPTFCLIALWVLWLSLVTAGRTFLQFQWDYLLLETGLLSIFVAPLSLTIGRGEPPLLVGIWLQRLLLFRLMFHSGMVKIFSGDSTWRNLTALDYHYETQPLPTWLGYYAYNSAAWIHRLSTGAMFLVEIPLAFLVLGPKRVRRWAFWPMVLLQAAIALTGNYCYFNLLTALLCLWLLDDESLKPLFRGRLVEGRQEARGLGGVHPSRSARLLFPVRTLFLTVYTVIVLLVSAVNLALIFGARSAVPRPLAALYLWVRPYGSINSYGLFQVMTTKRPEIIVEGSNDGQEWKAYEFKYKPGDPMRRPLFVAPHQPRLDWQMWFAALGTYQQNPWLINLAFRLLQGTPEVIDLLERNPFPMKPPKYIHATLYQYHFTTPEEKRQTGAWWRREYAGIYLPEVSLERK